MGVLRVEDTGGGLRCSIAAAAAKAKPLQCLQCSSAG